MIVLLIIAGFIFLFESHNKNIKSKHFDDLISPITALSRLDFECTYIKYFTLLCMIHYIVFVSLLSFDKCSFSIWNQSLGKLDILYESGHIVSTKRIQNTDLYSGFRHFVCFSSPSLTLLSRKTKWEKVAAKSKQNIVLNYYMETVFPST